jgi:hypothetical protein
MGTDGELLALVDGHQPVLDLRWLTEKVAPRLGQCGDWEGGGMMQPPCPAPPSQLPLPPSGPVDKGSRLPSLTLPPSRGLFVELGLRHLCLLPGDGEGEGPTSLAARLHGRERQREYAGLGSGEHWDRGEARLKETIPATRQRAFPGAALGDVESLGRQCGGIE